MARRHRNDDSEERRQAKKGPPKPKLPDDGLSQFNSKGYLLVDIDSGRIEAEKNGDKALPLASNTKMWTAATLVHLSEKHGTTFKVSEMRRYLARSDNDLGIYMAAKVMAQLPGENANRFAELADKIKDGETVYRRNKKGKKVPVNISYIDDSPTSNRIPKRIRDEVEGAFSKHMAEFGKTIHLSDKADPKNTSGMNWDGTGPVATPKDMAKIYKYLHEVDIQDKKRKNQVGFLSSVASPDGRHTMSGYLGGRNVEAAKSGTIRGNYVGSLIFKGENGATYAGFFNANSGSSRKNLAEAMLKVGRDGKEQSLVADAVDFGSGVVKTAVTIAGDVVKGVGTILKDTANGIAQVADASPSPSGSTKAPATRIAAVEQEKAATAVAEAKSAKEGPPLPERMDVADRSRLASAAAAPDRSAPEQKPARVLSVSTKQDNATPQMPSRQQLLAELNYGDGKLTKAEMADLLQTLQGDNRDEQKSRLLKMSPAERDALNGAVSKETGAKEPAVKRYTADDGREKLSFDKAAIKDYAAKQRPAKAVTPNV
jgi:hypothetical protein